MTTWIDNGTVEYSRPSNYQADKPGAKVSLSFSVAEGEDDSHAEIALARVSALAVETVHRMLGSPNATDDAYRAGMQAQRSMTPPAPAPTSPVPAPVPLGGPQSEVIPPSTPGGPTILRPYGGGTTADPMAGMGLPGGPPTNAAAPAPSVSTSTSPAPAPIGAGEIPDKHLVDAITAKNTRMLNTASEADRPLVPVKLARLVAQFVPPPGKVQQIPQEKRALFLAALDQLA